jgi:hypothetical protein
MRDDSYPLVGHGLSVTGGCKHSPFGVNFERLDAPRPMRRRVC